MKLNIEIKYGILTSLLLLLWLCIDFMAGFQNELIHLHVYGNIASLAVPGLCIWLGLKEKKDFSGDKISFRQAFTTAMIITFIAAVLTTPVQWIFINVINPDYFENMIAYSIQQKAFATYYEATRYFNFFNHVMQSIISTLMAGSLCSVALSYFMQTHKS